MLKCQQFILTFMSRINFMLRHWTWTKFYNLLFLAYLRLKCSKRAIGIIQCQSSSSTICFKWQPLNYWANFNQTEQECSLCYILQKELKLTGLRSAVGSVSGNRWESNCRSRGREFDPGPVPYFRGDWSWKNFYGHSPPFRWIIEEELLSVTSESMCLKYWLTACSSLPRKKCG